MMKSFTKYLSEKLIIDKNYMTYNYSPKIPRELREIIIKRYKEQGPGTKDKPIDFNDIDVSGMTSFYDKNIETGIFEETNFEYIDVSGWDTSNIGNMRFMFGYCRKLKELDLSSWNISSVQRSQYMFFRCSNLEKLLIPDFSKIENLKMRDMFHKCNPKSIPNWYTALL